MTLNNLINTNTSYNFFTQPWLKMEGIKNLVWTMYSEYEFDESDPVPTWEYYCDEDTIWSNFYDEVMSYLAFGDFEQHQFLNDEKDIDHFYSMYDKHGCSFNEDCINLFDEMRLVMMDTETTYRYFPLVQVW